MRVLTNARPATSPDPETGWLGIADGRIVGGGTGRPPAGAVEDLGGCLVVPGMVDTHLHGGAGAAFTDTTAGAARSIAGFNHRGGVTTVLASLVTAAPDTLLRQVTALADAADEGTIAGIHLEGPYLAPSRRGAHDPALLRAPDRAELARLIGAGRGHIRMITVAPELPGSLELISAAVDHGIVVAVGHTTADHDQARAAFDAGATVATHLYNAMSPLHHRAPGPIAAALTDDRVTVELVNDGVHLHPAVVRLAFSAAGADRVSLVTDAMAATGLGDGDYTLGGLDVRVVNGLATTRETGAIAGSTIRLPDAVRRAVHDVGISRESALRAATATPARALGLDEVGSLAPGGYADLAVVEDDLTVRAVMRRGHWLAPEGER